MKKLILLSIFGLLFGLTGCIQKEQIIDAKSTQSPISKKVVNNNFEIDYNITMDPIEYFLSKFGNSVKEIEDNVFEITMIPEDWDSESKYYYNFNMREVIWTSSYLDETSVPSTFYWGENQWYQVGTCKYYFETGIDETSDCSRVDESLIRLYASSIQSLTLNDLHSTYIQQQSDCNRMFDEKTGERTCESWVLFDENVNTKFYAKINEYMDKNYTLDKSITSEKYIKLVQEQIDKRFQ